MIEHVNPGDRIAAQHMNSMIDGINSNGMFIDEFVANTPGGIGTKPVSFILESESKFEGDELSSQKLVLSSIGCYNIRFETGAESTPISAADKIWTEDLDDISSIWLIKRNNSISVLDNTEFASIEETDINTWKLYDVEVSSDINSFSIVNDYRDVAFVFSDGNYAGKEVSCDMSSLNFIVPIDTSAQISVTGSGTEEDPYVVKSTKPDGTVEKKVLPVKGDGTLSSPGWTHANNGIHEYWVNGGLLKGGIKPLEGKWERVGGTIANPIWGSGGTIGNPYWKKPKRKKGESKPGDADGDGNEDKPFDPHEIDENDKILQNWNYNTPLSSDRVDITSVSAMNDYSFLVRPEPYGGKLKYANLSAVLSGGGEGGGGTPYGAFQFEVKTNDDQTKQLTFKYCVFQFGRKSYKVNGNGEFVVGGDDIGGTYYLYIPHSDPESAMIQNGDSGNTLDETCIPIVELDFEGKVVFDYRAMPVIPVWETVEASSSSTST